MFHTVVEQYVPAHMLSVDVSWVQEILEMATGTIFCERSTADGCVVKNNFDFTILVVFGPSVLQQMAKKLLVMMNIWTAGFQILCWKDLVSTKMQEVEKLMKVMEKVKMLIWKKRILNMI